MQISKHFTRREFACPCGCGFNTVDAQLLETLEAIREYFSSPVIITSACRCEDYNQAIGGAEKSKHKLGIAADIVVRGVEPDEVGDFVELYFISKGIAGGIGSYADFTHIDVREDRARWGK